MSVMKLVPVEPTSNMVTDGRVTTEEVERCETVADLGALFRKQWAFALAAAPTDETQGVKRDPVAWRVKDFADGWILYETEKAARSDAARMARALVQPLYAATPKPEAVSDAMVERAKAELFKRGIVDVFSVRASLTAALAGGE